MTNQIATGFTPNASAYLKLWIKNQTGRIATDSQIVSYFNEISHFHRAHIELGSHETISGHPEVADFDADDFTYAEAE